MLKKRIFALALATALFMQSLGTSAYAAGQSEVSQTTDETVVANTTEADTTEVMPEETSNEEVTSEEITTEEITTEVVTNEEVTTEEVTTQEVTTEETTGEEVTTEEITIEQMTVEAVMEDSVLESSGNYVVDNTLGHKIFVNETIPGSYNVQIKARYNKNGSSSDALSQENLYLVYTDNTTLSEVFYPDVTYVDEETLTAAGYKAISSDEFVSTDVDDWWNYRINATFCGSEGLKPATQYTYRLASRKADASAAGGYRYYFITVPQDFTTEAAITTSSVSFNNIKVETGYHHAQISFEVDANGESLLDVTTGSYKKYILKYIPASESDFSNAEEVNVSQYFDNNLGTVEGVYSATIKSLDGDVKARLETAVFTGDRVKTTVASEEIDIKFKDFSEADITVTEKSLSSGHEFTIDIDPWYEWDGVYDGYVINLYTKTGEENWKRAGYVSVDSARSYLLAKGLAEKTTYQYYIVIDAYNSNTGGEIWYYGSEEAPKTFTTGEIVTYEDSAFPDEVFRNFIKNKIGIAQDEKITSDKLEAITLIGNTADEKAITSEIKSIEGIQYLSNLEHIDLDKHGITDISKLKELKKLTYISFEDNNLTTMPDFSGFEKLSYLRLNGNKIDAAAITEDKIPEHYSEDKTSWIEMTKKEQRGEFSYILSDAYYANGNKYLFILGVQGVKESLTYELSVTIDGNTATVTEDWLTAAGDTIIINDLTASGITLSPGTYKADIVLEDEFGNKWVDLSQQEIIFVADTTTAKDVYIDATDLSCSMEVTIPAQISNSDISKVELIDDNNKVVGASEDYYGYYSTYANDTRYEAFASIWGFYLYRDATQLTGTITISEALAADDYHIRVTTTDETTYIAQNAVHATESMVVNEIVVADGYDQKGDYVYLAVKGKNLDGDKFYPELYYGNSAATQYVEYIYGGADTYIYKLKKLDIYAYHETFYKADTRIIAKENVTIIDNRKNVALSFREEEGFNVLYAAYDYKYRSEHYQAHIFKVDSGIKDGTKVEVTTFDTDSDNAKATGTVTDGMLYLYFENEYGYYQNYGEWESPFDFVYTEDGEEKIVSHKLTVKEYSDDPNEEVDDAFLVDAESLKACYAVQSDAYPMTLQLTKPYDTTVVKEITIDKPTAENAYYFVEEDFTDLDIYNVYRFILTDANGGKYGYTGYIDKKYYSPVITTPATGISLDITKANMQPEDTIQLTATVKPDNASLKTVAWSSDNTAVATVDSTGKVTAVSAGIATITASTHNGKTATCTINVFAYGLNKNTLVFDLSSETISETLVATDGVNALKGVTWSSSDISVATVDKNGKVTATGVGTATISAVVKDGPTLTCSVTVERSKIEKIALSASEVILEKDKSTTLRVYYIPTDVTCDKTIKWDVENDDIATVNEYGVITATAKGETKVIATVNGTTITAECKLVVLETVDEEFLQIPSNLTALTNVQKTLGDVTLPEEDGWKWQNGDIDLTKLTGMNEGTFTAVYQPDEYTKPVYKELLVALSTVTGINVQADNTKVLVGENTTIRLTWIYTGAEPDMSAYEDTIEWTNTKPAIAGVSEGTTQVDIDAKAKGSTNIQATVTVGEKEYSKKVTINVVEGSLAEIEVTDVTAFEETSEGTDYFVADKADVTTGKVTGNLTNATKLTVKNTNAKVVAVKAPKVNADGSYTIDYEVKAAGVAKLTLTANDSLKTTKEIWLQVKDTEPSVSTTAVTVNRLSEAGECFYVYPGPDAAIQSVALNGAGSENFEFNYEPATYKATIKTVNATIGTGKTDLKLAITLEDDSEKSADIKVTVNEKKPSFKVKQARKVNLFKKNTYEEVPLTITASDSITCMSLNSECDFEIREDNGNYYVAAKTDSLTTRCNKKGVLSVTYANYRGTYTYNFTASCERTAPKMVANPKSLVVYPAIGNNTADLNLLLNKAVVDLSDITVTIDTTDYFVAKDGNTITVTRTNLKQDKKVNAKLVLSCDEWVEDVKVPVTLSVNTKTPKVKLSTKTVQLNSNVNLATYDEAQVQVTWKDTATFAPKKITVTAANATSQNVLNKDIMFVVDENTITVKQNGQATAGNYSFQVNVTTESGYTASEKLSVKVKDTPVDKAVKVSAKGSIDVLNRENSYVTVTPKLTAVNGTITEAEVAGKFANFFEEPVLKDGQIYLYVKDDATLITKYNYLVNLVLTVENASGETTKLSTADLKIKLKQGKPKFVATPKKEVFFSNAYNSVTVDLSATLKGADNPVITDVELTNNTNAFDYSYNAMTQQITITLKDNGEAAKGKNYTLQFKVTLDGQASNEKANVVKYTVSVK